jgi:hypothetical protein
MLQRPVSIVIFGKENWIWVKGYGPPTSASRERQSFWTKEEAKLRGNYSIVKSAQRLSVTQSIRPRGRLQIIDM